MSYDVTATTLRGMTYLPPPAEELRLLDAELRQLDARRAQLLARRAWLVATLRSPAPAQAPAAPRPEAMAPRPEATAPRVQNVLLLLGGVLLIIAAMAFTLVSWGHLGIAGRGLVLGALTLAVLTAPVPLLRRGLRSTAESVAGLGLALTVLDAYALHETVCTRVDGTAYAAVAAAALAGLWAAYGAGLGALPGSGRTRTAQPGAARPTRPGTRPDAVEPGATKPVPDAAGLRLPLPAALIAAQVPLVLWAIAASAGPYGVTAALLVTAGFDTGVALRVTAGPKRVAATVGAYVAGAWGVPAAGWLSWTAAGPSAAARAAALLLLAAAIALGAARRLPHPVSAGGHALAAGLLVVAGSGGVLRSLLPDVWTVPAHLACGIALLGAVKAGRLPEAVRRGLAAASGAVQALAVLWTLPVVAVALLGPAGWAGRAWSGAPADARDAVTADVPWPPLAATAPLVLVAVATVVAVAVRTISDTTWGARALGGALTLAWSAALVLPATLELPYSVGLLAEGLTTAGLLLLTVHSPTTLARLLRRAPTDSATGPAPLTHHTPTVLALLTSASLALLSLASEPATLTVLALLTALFAGAARRPAPAAASLAYATALACATGALLGRQREHTALLVLAVPAAAALLATRVTGATRTAVEVTGAAAGLVAVGLAVTDAPMLALVLALCGAIAAGTAIRADRRATGYAAAALFVLAGWVRLASWGVGATEAYTLPVTVPALIVGALRRRRDPLASSWTAYGAGLTATLVPSLAAAWSDPHWPRPLLLGAAALLLTLLGARHRLRAPLLLGGAVLALDALHELAPYLVQVTDALPRWVPPALAGLLLLAVGATYEQRLKDVRRVREVLGKMY
ncbi:hypothetical protein ABZV31_28285 [Streptomyces sp. NPDC005202]|uniref:SCO7613 C-terminal domain-containing membrane protein n=1 Tax=Streptomyces sp. NPDC005202 TaxID=3157021 RepID=UPI0033B28CCF